MKVIIILIATFILIGCFGFKPFQPPPDPDKRWRKPGATDTEIVAALLECGVPTPRGPNIKVRVTMTTDEVALSKLCMEHSGFTSDFDDSWSGYCLKFKDINSCGLGTKAPSRDKNKRLNSQFCKSFPNADVCH
ncbi:hypothetical protein ISP15_17945 [Dyella jejuensis]|uniref:Uncharacterized protein n=1 Tax=Dyella jejuensis TaxID=1432009 RepID=A0ABW8JP25_9GAMM